MSSFRATNADEMSTPASDILDADLARRILAAAPNIIYVYDIQQQRSVFQNRRFGELLNHPPVDPNDPLSEWQHFIHPEDERQFSGHRERLKTIVPGEALFWEFRMRDADAHWRWFLSRDSLLSSDKAGKPLLIVGSASDITEQKKAEHYKDILAGEMRHRAKNLIPLIEGIGRLSRPKDQPLVDAFIDTFMGRLMTLLRTGDIVLSSTSRTADLRTVLDLTLAPFLDEEAPSRVTMEGPAIELSERTAGGLALAIHELATNAMKYGALSVDSGTVTLIWKLATENGKRHFELEWRESGGPPVKQPTTEGFGSRVIRHSVTHEPNGRIFVDYRPDGVHCLFGFDVLPGS